MLAATGRAGSPPEPAVGLAGCLGLAAAPTFASMAWISAVGSPGASMCSATSAALPIDDMALMYLLMGLFHLSPWLKLLSAGARRRDIRVTKTQGE